MKKKVVGLTLSTERNRIRINLIDFSALRLNVKNTHVYMYIYVVLCIWSYIKYCI